MTTCSHINLTKFIQENLDIEQKGQFFLCPFHTEKSPSMTITDHRYHCFGCGANGDAIDFLKEYYGISFNEACLRLGIKKNSMSSKEYRAKKEAQTALERDFYKIVEEDSNYRITAAKAISYGFEPRIFEENDIVFNQITRRLVFPLYSANKRDTELKGLAMRADPQDEAIQPKWLYNKGLEKKTSFFTIKQFPNIFKETDHIIITEGIADVLALSAHGHAAVCVGGSVVFDNQIEQILSLKPHKISIFGDPDEAGTKLKMGCFQKLLNNINTDYLPIIEIIISTSDPKDCVINRISYKPVDPFNYVAYNLKNYLFKYSADESNSFAVQVLNKNIKNFFSKIKDTEMKNAAVASTTNFSKMDCSGLYTSYLDNELGYILEKFSRETLPDSFKTGFETLDKVTSILPGMLVTLGAGTGVGKTTFMINIIANHIIKSMNDENNNDTIAFFEMEMSSEQICTRLAKIFRGKIQHELHPELVGIDGKSDDINNYVIYLADQLNRKKTVKLFARKTSLPELRMTLRNMKYKDMNLKIVFIDHVHLIGLVDAHTPLAEMAATQNINPAATLEKIMNELQYLATELNIVIFIAAQFSREEKDVEFPKLSSFKGSSSIEQNSSVVLLMSSPEKYWNQMARKSIKKEEKDRYAEKAEGVKNKIFIEVAKNREGKSGDFFEYKFDTRNYRFVEDVISL